MSNVDQIEKIKNNIALAAKKSGRSESQIKIIAVSKGFAAEDIRRVFTRGFRCFGENYVQEFGRKKIELAELPIEWHFIGHLQSNKVKNVVGEASYIHSVDRMKIVDEIAKQMAIAPKMTTVNSRVQKILLEVNLWGESTKSGVTPSDLPGLIDKVQSYQDIRLAGLMFMSPPELTGAEQQRFYDEARALQEKYTARVSAPHSLAELSMGTSYDYEAAIIAGATMVRIGTLIFGERDYA